MVGNVLKRKALKFLMEWLASWDRKPLIIRGARQVGKTWLVRQLATEAGKYLVEINFEKNPSSASLFSSNEPQQILLNLSALFNGMPEPEKCLLFLDEVQAAPQLLSKLRWFAEDMPQLSVIAAGSLLEFVLSDHSFSMPVGRIGYMHLEPLSFEEFLLARDKQSLHDYLMRYDLNIDLPIAIHQQLISLFKEYLLVGGLPAAVNNWIMNNSLQKVNQIQHDLLATYRDDFAKYRGRIPVERLDEAMMAIPKMLGQKIVYSRVNLALNAVQIKQVLNLLAKARICHPVWSTSANGTPLAAEIKDKYFKEIFLDVGLCSAALGFSMMQIQNINEINLINSGGIAEQVVGQLLRTINPPYIEPSLYYWQREEKGSGAEIDYIIAHNNKIVPIEVKAGRTGTLRSMQQFIHAKNLAFGLRINSDFPNKTPVKTKNHAGKLIEYVLLSLPFYLVGQIHRFLNLELEEA